MCDAKGNEKWQDEGLQAYLHSRAWNRNGAPGSNPLEEPFLHWIIVEGAVDVDGADGGPVDTLLLQQALCVQLALFQDIDPL